MNISGLISNSAGLVSAAASTIEATNQPEKTATELPTIASYGKSPVWLELNGTMVDLRDVSLIRKANDNSLCFVIILKTGQKHLTKVYSRISEYEFDWDIVKLKLRDLD